MIYFLNFVGISNPGRSSVEETNSGKSSTSRMKTDKHFLKENQKTITENVEHHLFSKNSSPRHRKNKLVADNGRDDQSNTETDLWWLNLPYVLVSKIDLLSDIGGQILLSLLN